MSFNGVPINNKACTKCGKVVNSDKGNFEICYRCFAEEKKATGEVCQCGRLKRPEFEKCKTCFLNEMNLQHRVCQCGKLKLAEFDLCRHCAYRKGD